MDLIETRWSTDADAVALAELHRAAWRNAYAGIIPGVTLERMLGRRGDRWWGGMHGAGGRALLIEFDGRVAGYATLGRNRARRADTGEIYELYVLPDCQGVGFGRRLFDEARRKLGDHGLRSLVVWALAENETGCRFYRAMGGREFGRGIERLGGVALDKVGFVWN